MLSDFQKDLARGQRAELIVLDILSGLSELEFVWVGNEKEYRYKGDIVALAADKEICIEVKDDECIATTGNILCEEENYIKEDGRIIRGNMYSDCDIYCILSQSERKLYVLDFSNSKEIYKRYGEYKVIRHAQQDTFCYLLELCRAKQFGALIKILSY